MYDLILCVLATTKNDRLSIFSKIGFKKTDKYKTKIIYLIDNETKPDFLDGEWHNSNCTFPMRFSQYLKNTDEDFRWIMQVDDDSCTDLEKTIDLLDKSYDHTDAVCLTGSSSYYLYLPRYIDQTIIKETCLCHGIDPRLQQSLREVNFIDSKDLNQFTSMPYINNGWENSVFSRKAVEKIQKNKNTQNFIDACLKNQPGFSDQVPFALANVSKIPISNCYFLSPMPNMEEYTAINETGRFSHIHHVTEHWDRLDIFEEIIKNKKSFANSEQINKYLEDKIQGTDWLFFALKDGKIISRCLIKFGTNIEVLNYEITSLNQFDFHDKNWSFQNDQFIIENQQGQKATFNKIKNNLYVCKQDQIFVLSKFHHMDMIYLSHNKSLENIQRRMT
jgi:hypothetical protein